MALEMEDSCKAELRFQLRDTKPSGGDIQLMEWSPKMDLLAAALADHSVRNKCIIVVTFGSRVVYTVDTVSCACSAMHDGASVPMYTDNTEPVVMATSVDYSSS